MKWLLHLIRRLSKATLVTTLLLMGALLLRLLLLVWLASLIRG